MAEASEERKFARCIINSVELAQFSDRVREEESRIFELSLEARLKTVRTLVDRAEKLVGDVGESCDVTLANTIRRLKDAKEAIEGESTFQAMMGLGDLKGALKADAHEIVGRKR